MKIAFFDRDGTINFDYPDAHWRNIRVPELMPGATGAMSHVLGAGYQIIIVTNQYLIGEGIVTKAQYDAFTDALLRELGKSGIEILDIFYCPHARWEPCNCSKPGTGMIEAALRKYPDIDLAHSFLVGDSPGDIQLAQNVGIASYGICVPSAYVRHTMIENISELKQWIEE